MAEGVVTKVTQGNPGDFNFDEWVTRCQIEAIKDLLVKHNAVTPSSLTTSSSQLKAVMSDPEFVLRMQQECTIIAKLIDAATALSSVIRVVISEEEQAVQDTINQTLAYLKQLQQDCTRLPQVLRAADAHLESKFKETTKQINQTFDLFSNMVEVERARILSELNASKESILSLYPYPKFRAAVVECGDNEAYVDDEKNDDALVSHIMEDSEQLIAHLRQQVSEYESLTKNNENRAKRKARILQIGKDVDVQCEAAKRAAQNTNDFIQSCLLMNFDCSTPEKRDSHFSALIEQICVIMNEKTDWKVVSASHKIHKAKRLSSSDSFSWTGSGVTEVPQWFTVEIGVHQSIEAFKLENKYEDTDVVKQIKVQVSNTSDAFDDEDMDSWCDVQSYEVKYSSDWQKFDVPIESTTPKSRFWRFVITNTHGGCTRLDQVKLSLADQMHVLY